MGFLSIFGKALKFDEAKKFFEIIRKNFVDYIINSFKQKHISKDPFVGFEFEFHKINYNEENKTVELNLTGQHDIIKSNIEREKNNKKEEFYFAHEFGAWMLEMIHSEPLKLSDENLIDVIETKVNNLYAFLDSKYGSNKFLSVSSFPMMGVGRYFTDLTKEEKKELIDLYYNKEENNMSELEEYMRELDNNEITKSLFFKDVCINYHPRFGCLARNIRIRRGKKVEIFVPLYKDINTNMTEKTDDEPFPGFIYMDAMGFGMGNCCIQMTFGSYSLEDAVKLYDGLLPLTPLILAISSSSPIFKGKLSDYDNRWEIISKSVDDRTEEEQDIKNLHKNYIYKSRYSPAYSYLENFPDEKQEKLFNDYPEFPINPIYYNSFLNNKIPKNLSKHFSNLLCRDPLAVFTKKINIENIEDNSHFENINSTNWNSVRFKLPRKSDGDTAFKIEVRTCELQLTPFENSAMLVLLLGMHELILNNDLNEEINYNDFIIPISLVDQNFKRAYQRDSFINQKFYWKVYSNKKNYEIKEYSINEIFNGNKDYQGLLNLIKNALSKKYNNQYNKYIEFIEKRTKGIIMTDAKYIRNFVLNHPKYNKDSIITNEINFDLISNLLLIQNKKIFPKELFN